jgi:uncharacterized protein
MLAKVENSGAWIETFTGRRFYVLDPRAQDVSIDDIAHALSMICRFTGHVREFYSVAEHSVRTSYACLPEDALWGLLHDASEAYVSDMSRPLKHTPEMLHYREAEHRIMNVIADHFGLDHQEPASVKLADSRLLLTEKRDLMPASPKWTGWGLGELRPLERNIHPMVCSEAEFSFRRRFKELTAPRG